MPLSLDFFTHKTGTTEVQCGVTDSSGLSGMQRCTSDAVLQACDALASAMVTELNGGIGQTMNTTVTAPSSVAAAAQAKAEAQAAVTPQPEPAQTVQS